MWRKHLANRLPTACRRCTSFPIQNQPGTRQLSTDEPASTKKSIRTFNVRTGNAGTWSQVEPPSVRSSDSDYISIRNGTFYRSYPSESDAPGSNPPLLSNFSFTLSARDSEDLEEKSPQAWAVIASSAVPRTILLQILAGQYLGVPPQARTYPKLSKLHISPNSAIKYIGFDAERGNSVGGTGMRGSHMSARYESRREVTDFSLRDYLTGNTELNALKSDVETRERELLTHLVDQLNLESLLDMPVANLSNGQTRRARIAKALMSEPKVLLLDAPFMGLDPRSREKIATVLGNLAVKDDLRLVLSLQPDDAVPDWINRQLIIDTPETKGMPAKTEEISPDGWPRDFPPSTRGEAVVQMEGVVVNYGDKTVLGEWMQKTDGDDRQGLWWSLHRGQRYGIFGPNGSGKTTMLSLITSDHPQAYSLPIKLFGKSRLPGPGEAGISVFDLQKRMGHSSPEVHAFFPKHLTIRRVLESAWADTPLVRPKLTATSASRVDGFLRWFARELNPAYPGRTFYEQLEDAGLLTLRNTPESLRNASQLYSELTADDSDIAWANSLRFTDMSFANQRLMLFLRAIVAQPDLVILDEALSGLDQGIKDKALLFLSHGQKLIRTSAVNPTVEPTTLQEIGELAFEGLTSEQALLVISHTKDDVPGCVREWICLPESGSKEPPRTGVLPGPLVLRPEGWKSIWGTATK